MRYHLSFLNEKEMIKYLLLLCVCAFLAGCYQMHSEDEMHTVPVTNNPNVLPHTAQRNLPTGVPY